MAYSTRKSSPSLNHISEAEDQITAYSRTVKFTVTEYSFEFIVDKLNSERYYVPNYQRELIWTKSKQSKFIESVLMGLPIPFVFFWQDKDGRMEIVDGSQRLRTIKSFMDNGFALRDLETIPAANGLKYSHFSSARQLKFAETSIRVIILDNNTDAITRTEMFARINTGGTTANDAEIRRGSLPGGFMNMIIELATDRRFVELTPISKALVDKREREELVTRFFAYLNSYKIDATTGLGDMPTYKEEPRRFYFSYVKMVNEQIAQEIEQYGSSDIINNMRTEFFNMLNFVNNVSPYGFTKSKTGKQVPRVRFESIAVGSALALRTDPTILNRVKDLTPLLTSDDFATVTRSDAANVKSKLLGRINLVRDWLLN